MDEEGGERACACVCVCVCVFVCLSTSSSSKCARTPSVNLHAVVCMLAPMLVCGYPGILVYVCMILLGRLIFCVFVHVRGTCGEVGQLGKQAGFAGFWKAYRGRAGPQPRSP